MFFILFFYLCEYYFFYFVYDYQVEVTIVLKPWIFNYISLKVNSCRFKNPPICSCWYKNNTLKVSHSWLSDFSSYLTVNFVNLLKSRLIFNLSHCFWMFTNFSYNSRAHISKSKECFNVKSSTYYFHMKTKILGDFQICISIPLRSRKFHLLWNIIFLIKLFYPLEPERKFLK